LLFFKGSSLEAQSFLYQVMISQL